MPSLFPRRPTQTITDTVNGIPVQYDIPDTTPIRKLPFNIDATLRRALFTLAIAMTIGAIIWGTVAIGSMLSLLAPPWAAYLVAGVFDAGWAACLIAEWLLRYDSKRAERPRKAGIALLVVSMAAIIVHGALAGPWGWIVGIVGALVSAAAKGIWAIGMHTIRIKLDPKHEAYLRTLQQRSGTEQALALGERDRLLTEDRTVALKLALEARRPDPVKVEQEDPTEPEINLPEPGLGSGDPAIAGGGLSGASPQVVPDGPAVQAAALKVGNFGFSAHLSAQSAQRAAGIAQVMELLKGDPGITSGQIAEELAVSPATAKRYLREARQAI